MQLPQIRRKKKILSKSIIDILYQKLYRNIRNTTEIQKYTLSQCFVPTEFSRDNTGHYEESSKELKAGDISSEDELVEAGSDSSEAAEDDPDGWRHQEEASQVNVIINSVDH